MTDIYIISGFLGAGKTTWIQKMMAEAFHAKRTVLIENDFGKTSVDASMLKCRGIEVMEMSSGCICCSLKGDFVKAIEDIIARFHPETILIEPSGVGKLSDVERSCLVPKVSQIARLAGKITVVDAERFDLYLENFGEFFEDQIIYADAIVFSHTEIEPARLLSAGNIVKRLNGSAGQYDEDWSRLNAKEIIESLSANESEEKECACNHLGTCSCGHGGGEKHEAHDHHTAEEVFETYTITTERIFSRESLEDCIHQAERLHGKLLRVKGILCGGDKNWHLDYVWGEVKITSCNLPCGSLTCIGQGLNKEVLFEVFAGRQSF